MSEHLTPVPPPPPTPNWRGQILIRTRGRRDHLSVANHLLGGPKPVQIQDKTQDSSAHRVPDHSCSYSRFHNFLISHLCPQPLPPPPFYTEDIGLTMTRARFSTLQGRGSGTPALGICFSHMGCLDKQFPSSIDKNKLSWVVLPKKTPHAPAGSGVSEDGCAQGCFRNITLCFSDP